MLDANGDLQTLSERLASCVCDVELPSAWQDYFEQSGVMPTFDGDGRRFPRFYARRKAALEHRQSLFAKPRPIVWHGVYTKNISRQGLGFLHSEQLFPGERMRIVLSDDLLREIEVIHCRRIQRRCYEIGAKFARDGHKSAVM